MGRRLLLICALSLVFLFVAAPAFACGGLVNPNGTVTLVKTTTLAAYVDGVEHYITSFSYAGGGGKFGSIVPLPGIPTSVERAGDWTLQRLVQEVAPPAQDNLRLAAGFAAAEIAEVQVLLETRIDALDITVLRGGAAEVARWAQDNGFELSPDAPEVLEFYAKRSTIFMAARFDAEKAAELGQDTGDGTPIQITIPTDDPWVPIRILALGRGRGEPVSADVFLLTQREPTILPQPLDLRGGDAGGLPIASGMTLVRSERASESLLTDLASDDGMDWMPKRGMWLSYLSLAGVSQEMTYDLAIDPSGAENPSWIDAGLTQPVSIVREVAEPIALPLTIAAAAAFVAGRSLRRRASRPA